MIVMTNTRFQKIIATASNYNLLTNQNNQSRNEDVSTWTHTGTAWLLGSKALKPTSCLRCHGLDESNCARGTVEGNLNIVN